MTKQEIYSELLRINEMSLQLEPKKALLDLMSRMCEGGLESENENRCFLPILAPQYLIGTLKIYIEPSLLDRTEPAPHQISQCKHYQEESSRISDAVLETLRSILDDPSL